MKKNIYKFVLPLFFLLVIALFSSCNAAGNVVTEEITAQVDTTTAIPPTKAAQETATSSSVSNTTIHVAQNSSAGDPYMPEIGNRSYDVQHYTLRITLDPQTYWLEANATLDIKATMDDLTQISLDFAGLEIKDVVVNNGAATFFRKAKKLYINMPAPISNGEQITISINYAGEPLQEASAYVPFVQHLGIQYTPNMLYIVSEPDGARYWMPVNDHPLDKATYHMEITVPIAYVAVSNGELIDTITSDDQISYVWELNSPAASSFITIAVGDYVRVESTSPKGITLRHYVKPENQAAFNELQPRIGEMIDWMSQMFGPYPFAEFGYVEVSDLGASLETQTMVIMSQDSLFDEQVLCHEMSHMWFGDWVNPDSWGDIWRNEGFATYISLMWANRESPQQLNNIIEEISMSLEADPSGFQLNNPPPEELFGRDSYYKGAVLVHQLRQKIGDDAFFGGLKTYFNKYGGGSASDAEFRTIMEDAAGQSLDEFFIKWFE